MSETHACDTAFPPPGSVSDDALTAGILGRRVWAWLIDAALLFAITCLLWAALLMVGLLTFGLALPLLGALPFLPLLYGTLFIASPMSATPGQVMQGLVVRRDADYGDPGVARAFATVAFFYVTFWASMLVQIVALVPFAGRRRLLHDILSGTVVVRARVLRHAFAHRR